MFERMGGERRRLLDSIVQLVYFMRGAIQYKDMFDMTVVEREAVSEFIEGRLEMEQKRANPQY